MPESGVSRCRVAGVERGPGRRKARNAPGLPAACGGGRTRAAPKLFVYISASRMPTFYDRFVENSKLWPQNIAVEVQKPENLESYSYAQLRTMAEAFAAWLVANAMPPGERIAILADNHPRWVAAYLGIIAAGGTAVPLDTAYHADQVAKLLRDSGASLLVCDSKHIGVAEEAVAGEGAQLVTTDLPSGTGARAPVAQVVADFDGIFSRQVPSFSPVLRDPDDIASLLYTSGTTADPKGVMLTHANLLAE